MEKMNTIYFDDECDLFFVRYEKYEIEEDGFPVDLNDYDEENYWQKVLQPAQTLVCAGFFVLFAESFALVLSKENVVFWWMLGKL